MGVEQETPWHVNLQGMKSCMVNIIGSSSVWLERRLCPVSTLVVKYA